MVANVVEIKNVTKKYHDFKALDNVSVTLEKGKIYGLIGQNGAGKTTMMRIISGLSFADSGSLNVDTEKIGTLIEYPSLNGGMTAYENMRFCYLMKGLSIDQSADELLELVGLQDTGKKKVKDFSLGMRQRLGIAIAMIGNPELLILDEPINGLDPIGVVEIRKLIQQLSTKLHYTILISSHNLPELDQVATDFIIIHHGRIRKIITAKQLQSDGCENLEEYFISVIEERSGKEYE